MDRKISAILLLCIAMLFSCSPQEFGSHKGQRPDHQHQEGLPGEESGGGDSQDGDSQDGNSQDEDIPDRRPVCFWAGISYPEEYDWKLDPEYGTVDCSMFLMDSVRRILEFPIGTEHEVASDPDMSRCIGGHLYTDYSTDNETVVRRDGMEIFRYAGREMIDGMEVVGQDVFTTGSSRDGNGGGWTFRKNGKIIRESSSGALIRPLYLDQGLPAFSHEEWGNGNQGSRTDYFSVCGEQVSQARPSSADASLIDFISVGGTLHLLCRKADPESFFLEQGGKETELRKGSPFCVQILAERLVPGDGRVFVTGLARFYNGQVSQAVWTDPEHPFFFRPDLEILEIHPHGSSFSAVCRIRNSGKEVLYLGGEYKEIPEEYTFCAGIFTPGHHCVCLNPRMPGIPPAVLIDGSLKGIDSNGYWIGISSGDRTSFPSLRGGRRDSAVSLP